MKLSEKQKTIIDLIRLNGQVTKKEVVESIGKYYYHNAEHYVGEILSNMVKKRYIKRIRNGVFELGSQPNQLTGIENKDQTKLF